MWTLNDFINQILFYFTEIKFLLQWYCKWWNEIRLTAQTPSYIIVIVRKLFHYVMTINESMYKQCLHPACEPRMFYINIKHSDVTFRSLIFYFATSCRSCIKQGNLAEILFYCKVFWFFDVMLKFFAIASYQFFVKNKGTFYILLTLITFFCIHMCSRTVL